MLPFVHRITKYDPADRDEGGRYVGAEDAVSDHGPVEAAYLEAVAAFAAAVGVERLTVREPGVAGYVHFGVEPAVPGHGLAGLFPPDLSGFHDGAEVPLGVGLELVRAMLRDSGAWCRLEVEGRFAAHVGWDQYLYVSCDRPTESAVERTRALGLFPEPMTASPYDAEADAEAGPQRTADEDFWARLRRSLGGQRAALLEEGYLGNASRWHRVTRENLDAVRAGLTPRSMLTVWPDLSEDVAAVLASLPRDGPVEFVWEDEAGAIHGAIVDEADHTALTARVSGARAAAALPLELDTRRPLFTGVLPDADGILRARWRTEPTESDRTWALLRTLRRGQLITGTVTEIASFGVTFVDIGSFTAFINIPELTWRPFDHPSDIVTVGQEITAEILDVDLAADHVPLSLKALEPDPMPAWVERVGEVVAGVVTKLVPFGAFVRVGEPEDGVEGLVHITELVNEPVAAPEDVVRVGEALKVRIVAIDLPRRRITLSRRQALGGA